MIYAIFVILILIMPFILIFISKSKQRTDSFKKTIKIITKSSNILLLVFQALLFLFATIMCLYGILSHHFENPIFIIFSLLFALITIGLIITIYGEFKKNK